MSYHTCKHCGAYIAAEGLRMHLAYHTSAALSADESYIRAAFRPPAQFNLRREL